MTDKIRKYCKRLDAKGFIAFANELNELIKQGYVICTEDTREHYPIFAGQPSITMVKLPAMEPIPVTPEGEIIEEGKPEVSTPRSVEDILEDKKASKEECIELAAKLGIELPESAKAPLAIKKVIKEKLAEQKPQGDEAPV